jgi:hypothetical protein
LEAHRERLANRKRAHDQLIVRRDEVDVDGAAQEPAQPQQTFDSGDTAAGNDNSEGAHARIVPPSWAGFRYGPSS